MRENRPSGSEGGPILIQSSLPLSIIWSLRDKSRCVYFTNHKSPFDALDACSGRAFHCSLLILATGEEVLFNGGMHSPVSVNHLSDSKVDANRDERDRFVFAKFLSAHEEISDFPVGIAHG
jgi:hypothetical protein